MYVCACVNTRKTDHIGDSLVSAYYIMYVLFLSFVVRVSAILMVIFHSLRQHSMSFSHTAHITPLYWYVHSMMYTFSHTSSLYTIHGKVLYIYSSIYICRRQLCLFTIKQNIASFNLNQIKVGKFWMIKYRN